MAQETDLDATFEQRAKAQSRFALSSAYAIGSGEPVIKTAGPTESGGSVRVHESARWHIGSISKTFTSTLVMQLVERSVLDLNVPIGDYLPAFRESMHPDWAAVTLMELLSHTSGLPANASRSVIERTYADAPYEGRRNVLLSMWNEPLAHDAGVFVYSNIGYVVAGWTCRGIVPLL